jgi:hypothetical protein
MDLGFSPSIYISHCKENSIYVFLSWELRGFSLHSCVCERDLYIPRIGPPIFLQQNKSLTDT